MDIEGKDYGITCPECDGEHHVAIDRLDGGRDYVCVRCGHVVVVSAESL